MFFWDFCSPQSGDGEGGEPSSCEQPAADSGRDSPEEAGPCGQWMIAFSCAWMNFFHRGLIRGTAVVYVQLIQTFGITREEAALPLSLVSAIGGVSSEPRSFTACNTKGKTIQQC